MGSPVVTQVHPLSEVRQRLSGILARFRREGPAAAPVAFGSHRKPEAVLLPYEVYERYEAIARQRGCAGVPAAPPPAGPGSWVTPVRRIRRVCRTSVAA